MSNTVKQIKALMKQKGISQADMADIIGVTHVTVHRWMNGTRIPTIEYVERMANVLEMKIGLVYKG